MVRERTTRVEPSASGKDTTRHLIQHHGYVYIYANKGAARWEMDRAGWSFLLALLYGVQGAELRLLDQGELKNDLAPVSISMMETHLSRRALSRADESTIVRAARDFSDGALNMLVNIAGGQLHPISVNSSTRKTNGTLT